MSDTTTTLPADVLERAIYEVGLSICGSHDGWTSATDLERKSAEVYVLAALPILVPSIETALLERIIADMHRIDRQSEMDEASAAMRDDYLRSFLPEEVTP